MGTYPKNGHVLVPQDPGLGVEMDWDFTNANKIDTKVFEQTHVSDQIRPVSDQIRFWQPLKTTSQVFTI